MQLDRTQFPLGVKGGQGQNALAIPSGDVVQPRHSIRLMHRAAEANSSMGKRVLDVSLSLLGLMCLWPLLVLAALAIRLDSPGPLLFRQERYGQGGKIFRILKFRTMHVLESSGAFQQARLDDYRVTRVGRFLRMTSIDELPQLFNVLRGDMSLVGPRPHAKAMDDYFACYIPAYRDRHLVRPGLTGLAQISGLRGPTDTVEAISERTAKDRAYIRSWSLAGDILIILRTPLSLIRHKAF